MASHESRANLITIRRRLQMSSRDTDVRSTAEECAALTSDSIVLPLEVACERTGLIETGLAARWQVQLFVRRLVNGERARSHEAWQVAEPLLPSRI